MTDHDPTDPMLRLGPLDREPAAVRPPVDKRLALIRDPQAARTDRRRAFLDALGPGVELLGVYDLRMLDWLAGWDTPTVGSIACLIWRARAAEHRAALRDLRGGGLR